MNLHAAVMTGNESAVRVLLRRKGGVDVNTIDDNGLTPLWRILLIYESRDWHPGMDEVTRLLLEQEDIDVDFKNYDGTTLLMAAAILGASRPLQMLCEKDNVNLNCKDKYGNTALMLASEKGCEAVVAVLLRQNGIELEVRNESGRTALDLAVENSRKKVVELLLDNSVTGQVIKGDRGRALILSALKVYCPYSGVVEALIRHVAMADFKDECGRTPLSIAAERGSEDIVRLLVTQYGASPNSRCNMGRTPLSYAVERTSSRTSLIELLLSQAKTEPDCKDNNGQTPLSIAAEQGNEKLAKLLLQRMDVNPNSRNNDGSTPLLLAVVGNHKTVVRLLLNRHNIDVNATNRYGQTPLMSAIEGGHLALVELLLKQEGIELGVKDSNDSSPVLVALIRGHTEIVPLLLAMDGVDPNARNKDGQTPLLLAIDSRQIEMVKMLLKRDEVDLDLCNSNDQTPLSLALERNKLDDHTMIADLAIACAKRNSKDLADRSPLSWAAENGLPIVVQQLLNGNLDPNSQDGAGRTPLSRAVKNAHEAVIRLLVGFDQLSLHLLIQEGNLTSVVLLLRAGYDVDARDTFGRTPLHLSVSPEHLTISAELLSFRAEVNTEDLNGVTPLRLAMQSKNEELISLLLEHGADIQGVTTNEWFEAYERSKSHTLELLQVSSQNRCVRFIEGIPDRMSDHTGKTKRIILTSNFSSWSKCLSDSPGPALEQNRSHVCYHVQRHGLSVSITVTAYFPIPKDSGEPSRFDISNWAAFGIAWTITAPLEHQIGSHWNSIDHFSMLSNGWIPDDGITFFTQFVQNLMERWLELCNVAEEHLSSRRLSQLRAKGKSSELISDLAEDAQDWAELRSILRDQVRTSRNFAVEYCALYHQDKGGKAIRQAIDDFAGEVHRHIDRLEQTVKDLLQFEFAWVSINEAHRSTSLATSMKRLSWITFIFLSAMFASSLFGLNVDILQRNPNWRWFLLFAGGFLALTIAAWLLFRYGQIEGVVERQIGNRLERWCWKSASYIRRPSKPHEGLPISEQPEE